MGERARRDPRAQRGAQAAPEAAPAALADRYHPGTLTLIGPKNRGTSLRFASLVAETVARLATGPGGLTPGRTGFAPAGRQTKFHEVIAALHSASTRRAWSHCLSYPHLGVSLSVRPAVAWF